MKSENCFNEIFGVAEVGKMYGYYLFEISKFFEILNFVFLIGLGSGRVSSRSVGRLREKKQLKSQLIFIPGVIHFRLDPKDFILFCALKFCKL